MASETERLDRFGLFLIEHIRDQGLRGYTDLVQGKSIPPALVPLQNGMSAWSEEQQTVGAQCLAVAIDDALHDFLFHLGELAEHRANNQELQKGGAIQIVVDGNDIAQLTDTLPWKLFGEDGRIERFSEFRHLSDMFYEAAIGGELSTPPDHPDSCCRLQSDDER